MRKGLARKVISLVGILTIIVIGGGSAFLINEKYLELKQNIDWGVQQFAQMITKPLMSDFDTYSDTDFWAMKRGVQNLLELNSDIEWVEIVKYSGEIAYDSRDDFLYDENHRLIDERLKSAIEAIAPSYLLGNGLVVPWDELSEQKISQAIYPYLDNNGRHEYTIVYGVTYGGLLDRLIAAMWRIGGASLFAIVFGIGGLTLLLYRPLLKKEKQDSEIELAAGIQKRLLPRKLPQVKNIEITGDVITADKVGGDIFDVISVEKGLLFYVGDVTGHGIPAGLVSGMVSALVYGIAGMTEKISEVFRLLNNTIWSKTGEGTFVTMIMGRWDDDRRRLNFACAGHEPALFFNKDKDRVEEMCRGGAPIGMFEKNAVRKRDGIRTILPGDITVFYSDGVTEAVNRDGGCFGRDRLKRLVLKSGKAGHTAAETKENILNEIESWGQGKGRRDDITVLVLKGIQ